MCSTAVNGVGEMVSSPDQYIDKIISMCFNDDRRQSLCLRINQEVIDVLR